MSSTVKVKNSTTGGNVPSSLAQGELAVNLVDKRFFSANSTQIFDIFQNTVSNIAISNTSGYLKVGNSTVNSFVNSTSLALTVNSTVYFVIQAPSAADYAAATKVLLANGSFGAVTASASPGGSNTNIQYNDSGATNGSNSFAFDKTSNTVTAQNEILTGTLTANADFLSMGNSTINSVVNSIAFVTGNSTLTATLNSTALMFGTSSIGGASQTNGYSVMPNGLILQWGYVACNTSAGTITFPLPFPTAVFSVVTTPSVSIANAWVNAASLSLSSVGIRTTANANCFYFAIGK